MTEIETSVLSTNGKSSAKGDGYDSMIGFGLAKNVIYVATNTHDPEDDRPDP